MQHLKANLEFEACIRIKVGPNLFGLTTRTKSHGIASENAKLMVQLKVVRQLAVKLEFMVCREAQMI